MKIDKTVTKEDLNGADKRRVLENFVENDEALSLLLDFISSKYMTITHTGAKGTPLGGTLTIGE